MRAIAVLALLLGVGGAAAQDRTGLANERDVVAKIAAEASEMTTIKLRCPSHVRMDATFAADLQRALLGDGIKRVGKEPFVAMMRPEQAAIREEAARIGDAAWCRARRAGLAKTYPDLFPN